MHKCLSLLHIVDHQHLQFVSYLLIISIICYHYRVMHPYQRESSATMAAVTCVNVVKRYYLVYWLLVSVFYTVRIVEIF